MAQYFNNRVEEALDKYAQRKNIKKQKNNKFGVPNKMEI